MGSLWVNGSLNWDLRKSRSKSAREKVWRGDASWVPERGLRSRSAGNGIGTGFLRLPRGLLPLPPPRGRWAHGKRKEAEQEPEPPPPFLSPGRRDRPLTPHLRSCVALALPKSFSHGKRARGSPCWTRGRGGGREHLQREAGHAVAPPLGLGGGFPPTGRGGALASQVGRFKTQRCSESERERHGTVGLPTRRGGEDPRPGPCLNSGRERGGRALHMLRGGLLLPGTSGGDAALSSSDSGQGLGRGAWLAPAQGCMAG